MTSLKPLIFIALAISPSAMAQTVNRNRATVTEVSQNTAGMTTKTTTVNPDTSIPDKICMPQPVPPLTRGLMTNGRDSGR